MFLLRMLSVKKVKNRSAAFGPSAAITAGTAGVAVRSMVAGSVVAVASGVGLVGKFMVACSGPEMARIKGVMRAISAAGRATNRPQTMSIKQWTSRYT